MAHLTGGSHEEKRSGCLNDHTLHVMTVQAKHTSQGFIGQAERTRGTNEKVW